MRYGIIATIRFFILPAARSRELKVSDDKSDEVNISVMPSTRYRDNALTRVRFVDSILPISRYRVNGGQRSLIFGECFDGRKTEDASHRGRKSKGRSGEDNQHGSYRKSPGGAWKKSSHYRSRHESEPRGTLVLSPKLSLDHLN